jgi:hypothetical protein
MTIGKIEILLSSPAFWLGMTVVAMEGLKAILPSLNGTALIVVQFILACLVAILHSNELQMAGATGMLGSKSILRK